MNPEAQLLCDSIMRACDIKLSKSDCVFENGDGATTVSASCLAALDTRSTTVQTDINKVKKLRNQTTITEDGLVPRIETKIDDSTAHVCDIHAIITLNVVARNLDENTKSVSGGPSDDKVLSNESSLPMKMKESSKESSIKKKEIKRQDKCTCTIKNRAPKAACGQACEYTCMFGGIGSSNAFSLGTADHRLLLRDKCNSMLIGGCRVPVCRNFKN